MLTSLWTVLREWMFWWIVPLFFTCGGCLGGGFFEPQSSLRYNPWLGTYEFTTSQEQGLTAKGVRAWKDATGVGSNGLSGSGFEVKELAFANESAALLNAMVATMEAYRTQMIAFTEMQDKVNQGIAVTLQGLQGMVTQLGQAVPGLKVDVQGAQGAGGNVTVTPAGGCPAKE